MLSFLVEYLMPVCFQCRYDFLRVALEDVSSTELLRSNSWLNLFPNFVFDIKNHIHEKATIRRHNKMGSRVEECH